MVASVVTSVVCYFRNVVPKRSLQVKITEDNSGHLINYFPMINYPKQRHLACRYRSDTIRVVNIESQLPKELNFKRFFGTVHWLQFEAIGF